MGPATKKLTDLDPRWLVCGPREGMGLSFDCPLHGPPCRIAVYFDNPLDGGPPAPRTPASHRRWNRLGRSFLTLCLSPEIEMFEVGRCPACGTTGLPWIEGHGHAPHQGPAGVVCTETRPAVHFAGRIRRGEVHPA